MHGNKNIAVEVARQQQDIHSSLVLGPVHVSVCHAFHSARDATTWPVEAQTLAVPFTRVTHEPVELIVGEMMLRIGTTRTYIWPCTAL